MKSSKLTKTTTYHYFKFAWRTLLLLAMLVIYIVEKVRNPQSDPLLDNSSDIYVHLSSNTYIAVIEIVVWVVFVVDMLARFFPTKIESMGCQKQFKRNYVPIEPVEKPEMQSWKRTFAVFAVWIALNAVPVTLYLTHIIDGAILILLSLAYAVCDMICILFFCPFQTWFMKNRCCVACRIYNWDFPMMFTPVVFIVNAFWMSLFAIAAALLVEWEILYHKYPERFCRNTNESLSCANCTEKLCKHKRQLQGFIKKLTDLEKLKLTRKK